MTPLSCPNCRARLPVPPEAMMAGDTRCIGCGRDTVVRVFPAFWQGSVEGELPENVLADTESSCFYHADNRAVRACDSCGRFLCSLCEIEVGEQHICPKCLAGGRGRKKPGLFEQRRIMWGNIALVLAILPALTVYFTVVTAPAVLFISVWRWNSPGGVVSGQKWRLALASIIALVELSLWGLLFYFVVSDVLG